MSLGLSAYWWVMFCGALVWLGFRRIESVPETDRRSYAVAIGIGFVIVLIASSGVEALRLYSLKAALPFSPGGMLGGWRQAAWLSKSLGFTGGTLILLLAFAAGLSLFTGVSWLTVIERLGTWLETALSVRAAAAGRSGRTAAPGEQAVIEREEVVEVRPQELEIHEPIRIEPPPSKFPNRRASSAKSRCRCSRTCRIRRCRRCICSTRPEQNVEVLSHGNAGIHLAPDREKAARFRRRSQSASPPIRAR